ncbi:MAG TPA: PaaI family thioesterase [Pyrinomonadaceae bacterium]|jgi:uncharacterized protein (TIGR00369 family)|nr:PaaI family thioesterase [Pyrinomonadaceae bacterium]
MDEAVKMVELTDKQKQRAADAVAKLPLGKLLGMRLTDIRPNEASIEITMHDDLRQPNGVLHGGVTATLIDTAMAFAVIPLLGEGETTATVDLTIHYVRPHTEGVATCTAKIVRAGKRFFTVSADVTNESGQLIATAISTYTRVSRVTELTKLRG